MKKFTNIEAFTDDDDEITTRWGKMKPFNHQINENAGFVKGSVLTKENH